MGWIKDLIIATITVAISLSTIVFTQIAEDANNVAKLEHMSEKVVTIRLAVDSLTMRQRQEELRSNSADVKFEQLMEDMIYTNGRIANAIENQTEEFATVRENLGRIDERIKHLEK